MKPGYLTLLAAPLFLLACSSLDNYDLHTWIEQNEGRAGTELKWSEYYQKFHQKVEQAEGMPGRSVILESTNTMYKAALAAEDGKLNWKEFGAMHDISNQRIAEAESGKGPASSGAASGAGWGKGSSATSLNGERAGK